MDIVAQLLQSINASRPTEMALQNDNRRLNDEIVSLQAELRQAKSKAETSATTAAVTAATTAAASAAAAKTIRNITQAYTVLKRGTIIKDMVTVYHDFVTAGMVPGSDEHTCQITRLVAEISAATDDALTTGVDCDIVDKDDMKHMYCSEKDKEWLLEQLQNDITTTWVEPWM